MLMFLNSHLILMMCLSYMIFQLFQVDKNVIKNQNLNHYWNSREKLRKLNLVKLFYFPSRLDRKWNWNFLRSSVHRKFMKREDLKELNVSFSLSSIQVLIFEGDCSCCYDDYSLFSWSLFHCHHSSPKIYEERRFKGIKCFFSLSSNPEAWTNPFAWQASYGIGGLVFAMVFVLACFRPLGHARCLRSTVMRP